MAQPQQENCTMYIQGPPSRTQTAPYQGDLWPAVVLSKPKLDLATFK